MHISSTATGCLLGLAATASAQLHQRDECVEDALYNCFTSSLVQATRYCTNSVVTVADITNTATITPTVTITEAVTETATVTTTRTIIGKRSKPRRKRGGCSPKPPACLANLPSSFQPAQFTSACSCIGITTTTHLATITGSTPETAVETQTVTDTFTVTEWVRVPNLPEPETSTTSSTSDVETPTSTTSDVETSTSTTPAVETSTSTTSTLDASTTAPAPSAVPMLENGDFETGALAPWTVSMSTTPGGYQVSLIQSTAPNGGSYMFDLFTSYFLRGAVSAVAVQQPINCNPGTRYTLTLQYSVVSSYTNNSPWSIVVGTNTLITSGPGSPMAWTTLTRPLTCGQSAADNVITIKLQSNPNRAAHLLVDNVVIVPVV